MRKIYFLFYQCTAHSTAWYTFKNMWNASKNSTNTYLFSSLFFRAIISFMLLIRRLLWSGKNWRKSDYLTRASPPSRAVVWSRALPSKRWGHRARSDWRNSRASVDESWWWRWCPDTGQGSTRRTPRDVPPARLPEVEVTNKQTTTEVEVTKKQTSVQRSKSQRKKSIG